MANSLLFGCLCAAHGLPIPEAEYRFHPKRKWRFDYYWSRHRLALEIEGGAFSAGRHTRGKGFLADIEKYNEAAIMGITVLRATPQMVKSGEAFGLVRRFVDSAEIPRRAPAVLAKSP